MSDANVERSRLTVCPPERGRAADDEVGAHELTTGCQQPAEQRRRHRERRIGDHSERTAREAKIGRVGLHDDNRRAGKPLAQRVGPLRVQLDRDDARPGRDERFGDRAGPRADVDHEVSGPHPRFGDQSLCGYVSEPMPSPP